MTGQVVIPRTYPIPTKEEIDRFRSNIQAAAEELRMPVMEQSDFYIRTGDRTLPDGTEILYDNPAYANRRHPSHTITLANTSSEIPVAIWEPHDRWTRMMMMIEEDWENMQGIKSLVYPILTFQEESIRWNDDKIWFENTNSSEPLAPCVGTWSST